jgi:hypothetical protein
MANLEDTGLSVLNVSDLACTQLELGKHQGDLPNVVRLESFDDSWSDLHKVGFVIRPTWIHWVCPLTTGSADLIGRQSSNQGRRSRSVATHMQSLELEISDPITPIAFDEWAQLYRSQVANMPHGLNLAERYRSSILAEDERYVLMSWRRDGRMVCGSVVRQDDKIGALVGRFGAVSSEERSHDLTRGMYLGLADFAARRGMQWLSLGNDPNFYGTLVKPGLCAYKMRLGFAPVPADLFGNSATRTVAESVTSLRGLDVPVLRFEYTSARDPNGTVEDFVDGAQALGLVAATTPDDEGDTLTSLPPHRRLLVDM